MIIRSHRFRQSVSIILALILSALLAWVLLGKDSIFFAMCITGYVMQTSVGSALHQGLQKFLVLIALVIVAALVIQSMTFLYVMARAVLLGALVGIVVNVLVLPRTADKEFRHHVIPILLVYQQYLNNMMDHLRESSPLQNNAAMETALLHLPGWVLAKGFDTRLQSGYQFFLIKLMQVADVIFAMHYLARFPYDAELLTLVGDALHACQLQINHFVDSLLQVLRLEALTQDVQDFAANIDILESKFYQLAPPNLELLDIRLDYVNFAEFIFCLRDLEEYLVRMGEALH